MFNNKPYLMNFLIKKAFLLFTAIIFTNAAFSQTSSELIDAVKLDSLVKTVREFSGEDSCLVTGSKVRILNRVSSSGNDLAADYLVERLDSIEGISVVSDVYSAGGRNVYGTQLGSVYLDSVVIIGCHYDAVADYCADDNASGVGILLEAARILSQYQFKRTIVYAFWDEEEIGLLGSKHHALQVSNASNKIVAVLNIDMAGYDANDDGIFDIDLNTNAGSVKMKDDLVGINNTNGLNITPMVVQPGTFDTDHASFWIYGYPAVLLGESWETNDQNSKYHTAQDRISLFNLPYYHEIAKLAITYIGQTAEPINGVSVKNDEVQEPIVFVNPVTNYVHVTTGNASVLSLLDVNGQLLFQKQLTSGHNMIDLSYLSGGTYLLKIYSNDGNSVSEKKIIIQN
jgi:hypothetical protein